MANPEKGEVALQVGARVYTLRFGWNEIAELEDLLNVHFSEDIYPRLKQPGSIRVVEWRAMLWATLGGQHSGIDLRGAGTIIGEAGLEAVAKAIAKAFTLSFPPAEEVEENPQPAGGSAGTTQ